MSIFDLTDTGPIVRCVCLPGDGRCAECGAVDEEPPPFDPEGRPDPAATFTAEDVDSLLADNTHYAYQEGFVDGYNEALRDHNLPLYAP